MRAAMLGAVVACAAGVASAATVGVPITIDFEDVALGSYTTLTLGDYQFEADDGSAFEVVQGDLTTASANATRTLSKGGDGYLRLTRTDGDYFGVLNVEYSLKTFQPSINFSIQTENDQGGFGLGGPSEFTSSFQSPGRTQYFQIGLTPDGGLLSLDNFELTGSLGTPGEVPLPASVLLLGAALAGLGLVRLPLKPQA